jgi:hypothetical protein
MLENLFKTQKRREKTRLFDIKFCSIYNATLMPGPIDELMAEFLM